MKKIILCISLLCMLSIAGIAQRTTTATTTTKSGISLRLGTISGSKLDFSGMFDALSGSDDLHAEVNPGSFNADIIGRCYVNEQLAKRLSLGISSLNYKLSTKRNYTNNETDEFEASLKQTKINLTPAVERHFKNDRIDILTGIGFPLSIIGKTKFSAKTVNTFVSPSSTNTSEDRYEISGGFGIGVQSFAGFNFIISDKFSAGTEISYGLGYISAGGKATGTSTSNGTTTTNSDNKLKMKGFKTSGLNGALVLTMNF